MAWPLSLCLTLPWCYMAIIRCQMFMNVEVNGQWIQPPQRWVFSSCGTFLMQLIDIQRIILFIPFIFFSYFTALKHLQSWKVMVGMAPVNSNSTFLCASSDSGELSLLVRASCILEGQAFLWTRTLVFWELWSYKVKVVKHSVHFKEIAYDICKFHWWSYYNSWNTLHSTQSSMWNIGGVQKLLY